MKLDSIARTLALIALFTAGQVRAEQGSPEGTFNCAVGGTEPSALENALGLEGQALSSSTRGLLINYGYECALVSDTNMKISSGMTLRNPDPRGAMFDLMDCMHEEECYKPGNGMPISDKCMARLCECNQKMVRENIECGHSRTFDCERLKRALENGGAGVLGGENFLGGHAVEVTAIDCKHNVGFYQDPNNPDTEVPFRVDDNDIIRAPGGYMNGRKVVMTYSANQ